MSCLPKNVYIITIMFVLTGTRRMKKFIFIVYQRLEIIGTYIAFIYA